MMPVCGHGGALAFYGGVCPGVSWGRPVRAWVAHTLTRLWAGGCLAVLVVLGPFAGVKGAVPLGGCACTPGVAGLEPGQAQVLPHLLGV